MSGEAWLAIIVAVISSGFINKLLERIFGKHDALEAVKSGMREIMFDRIDCLGNQYLQAGGVDRRRYESLIRMHEIYHNDLGGNGYLDDIMARVKKLPITD